MSKDWTERELQQASRAMKSMGHMSYEEFCAAVEIREGVTPKMNLRPNDTVELADGTLFTLWYENRGKGGAKLRYLNWKFQEEKR